MRPRSTAVNAVVTISLVTMATISVVRFLQSKRKAEDDASTDEPEQETLPSIISHFSGVKLTETTTIEEANKRRTACYYQKARDAHSAPQMVYGYTSYPRLRNQRQAELDRIFKYRRQGTKSHRTVVVMCDDTATATVLSKARSEILEPLQYSTDVATRGVWIPEASLIPEKDFHVTVALPWWWHTVPSTGNLELSQELAARLRQAVIVGFHHPFQIELERFVLLGGKTLVALWRCIGDRQTENGIHIYDRHGEAVDPMARLRHEIVRCFTMSTFGKTPLTYTHHRQSSMENGVSSLSPTQTPIKTDISSPFSATEEVQSTPTVTATFADGSVTDLPPVPPPRQPLERANTIERRSPGMSNSDGFIHTTLARLPLDCLSMSNVDLEPIHRLCREATATYCGHRMVVSKFRFLETTGKGGESNPCVAPIFDETIEAPVSIQVVTNGIQQNDLHVPKQVQRHATIGAVEKVMEKLTATELFDGTNVETVGQGRVEDAIERDPVESNGSVTIEDSSERQMNSETILKAAAESAGSPRSLDIDKLSPDELLREELRVGLN